MNDMTPPVVDGAPLEFNPLDPAFIADPYPFYRRLRETAPVFKTPQGFWLITRYEDVAFALRDKRFGKDFVGNMKRRYGAADGMNEPAIASLARTMLVQDPPDHTRLRGLVTKAFTARRVADMRPRIKKIVDEQLDRVADQGRDGRHARSCPSPAGDRDLRHAGHSRGSSRAVPGRQQRQRPHPRAGADDPRGDRPGQLQHPGGGRLLPAALRPAPPRAAGRSHHRAGAGRGGGRQAHGRGAARPISACCSAPATRPPPT